MCRGKTRFIQDAGKFDDGFLGEILVPASGGRLLAIGGIHEGRT